MSVDTTARDWEREVDEIVSAAIVRTTQYRSKEEIHDGLDLMGDLDVDSLDFTNLVVDIEDEINFHNIINGNGFKLPSTLGEKHFLRHKRELTSYMKVGVLRLYVKDAVRAALDAELASQQTLNNGITAASDTPAEQKPSRLRSALSLGFLRASARTAIRAVFTLISN